MTASSAIVQAPRTAAAFKAPGRMPSAFTSADPAAAQQASTAYQPTGSQVGIRPTATTPPGSWAAVPMMARSALVASQANQPRTTSRYGIQPSAAIRLPITMIDGIIGAANTFAGSETSERR